MVNVLGQFYKLRPFILKIGDETRWSLQLRRCHSQDLSHLVVFLRSADASTWVSTALPWTVSLQLQVRFRLTKENHRLAYHPKLIGFEERNKPCTIIINNLNVHIRFWSNVLYTEPKVMANVTFFESQLGNVWPTSSFLQDLWRCHSALCQPFWVLGGSSHILRNPFPLNTKLPPHTKN